MTLPDPAVLPHLEHIRNTLWKTPGSGPVSVMVGSGFSRNATPIVMGARPFPLWGKLAESIAKAINLPPEKAINPLKIAQMYASLRTPMDLNRLIESEIPDAEHRPGPLHHRLLSLPWTDVFSTNYDTLLERAAVDISQRKYEIIRSHSDIPLRPRPRLVKLHGTIGTGHPLVATEEDYRRYPNENAPFVNLVRNAVMENVLVLLGFSGDDPNFLEWIGWVRDALGAHAPSIFLCGILDSSPAMNAVLRDRKVTPLDLTSMFPHAGEAIHAQAAEWLLEYLHAGKSSPPNNHSPRKSDSAIALSPPAVAWTASPEPPARTPAGAQEITAQALLDATKAWSAQRHEYPGWHVAPNSIRQRVEWRMDEWRVIVFERGDTLPLVDRLLLARELCWRLELCLSPVFTNETDRLVQWLEAINPFPQNFIMPGAEALQMSPDSPVAVSWRVLALQIMRTAREDLDEARYLVWKERLERVAHHDEALRGELRHEQQLWHLNALDLPAFHVELAKWKSEASHPLELMRLASYHAESGDSATAIQLSMSALQSIRGFQRKPETASLEAWCCFLLGALHTFDGPKRQEWRDRVTAMKASGYDLWEIFNDLRDDLKSVRPPVKPARQRVAGFDPGSIREQRNFAGASASVMPAFRLLRLMERAPCPIFTGNVNMLGDSAAHAAVWLSLAAPSWALSTTLRANAKTEVIDEAFDRAAVALLPTEQANHLVRTLAPVVSNEIEALLRSDGNDKADLSLRVTKAGLELLSRFTLRMSAEELMDLLRRSVVWLSEPRLTARRQHGLGELLYSLVDRTVEALPDALVGPALSLCLDSPLPGEKDPKAEDWDVGPDPVDAFKDRDARRDKRDETRWPASWARINSGLKQGGPVERERAFHRALSLWLAGWLSEAEGQEFADALWSQRSERSGLPVLRNIRLSVSLLTPAPAGIDVTNMVKEELLTRPLESWASDAKSINLGKVAEVRVWLEELRSTFRHPVTSRASICVLPLSEVEVEKIVERLSTLIPEIEALAEKTARGTPFWPDSTADVLKQRLASLIGDSLLMHLPREHALVDVLDKHLDLVRPLVLTTAKVAMLRHHPERAAKLETEVGAALLTADADTLKTAAASLVRWCDLAKADLVPQMPSTLLRRAVERFVFRKGPALDSLASCLDHVIKSSPGLFDSGLIDLICEGLNMLAEETEVSLLRQRHDSREIDRVGLVEALHHRAWAAGIASELAILLRQQGAPLPIVLQKWKSICAREMLPEIRRAWKETSIQRV